jgi:excinuclease UvrABC ATPase subunit
VFICVPLWLRTNTETPQHIEIRGARENNLKNVSLHILKRKITISGKSSILFDTRRASSGIVQVVKPSGTLSSNVPAL